MFRGILHAISNENSPSSVSLPNSLETSHRALRRTQPIHTLASMSSVAAAADAPEEFAALADDAVDDFMSEAASDVEVFATTEGHRDVSAEEIRFLTRDAQAHDRVVCRVARLPRRGLRYLLGAAGFEAPVWQTRIRRATTASLAEEVGEWYRSGAAPKRIVEAALAAHAAQELTFAVFEIDRAHRAMQIEIDRVDRQRDRQPAH